MKELGIIEVLASQVQTMPYQGHGMLLLVTDEPAQSLCTWDVGLGRYVRVEGAARVPVDGINYDAQGRVASVVSDGVVTTFNYDGRGRVGSVVRGATTLTATYDNSGRLTAFN